MCAFTIGSLNSAGPSQTGRPSRLQLRSGTVPALGTLSQRRVARASKASRTSRGWRRIGIEDMAGAEAGARRPRGRDDKAASSREPWPSCNRLETLPRVPRRPRPSRLPVWGPTGSSPAQQTAQSHYPRRGAAPLRPGQAYIRDYASPWRWEGLSSVARRLVAVAPPAARRPATDAGHPWGGERPIGPGSVWDRAALSAIARAGVGSSRGSGLVRTRLIRSGIQNVDFSALSPRSTRASQPWLAHDDSHPARVLPRASGWALIRAARSRGVEAQGNSRAQAEGAVGRWNGG